MKYRVLDTIPQSGSAPEFFFGVHQAPVVWIEFEYSDSNKWYGVFELGKLTERNLKVDLHEDHLTVLAQGNFYKINAKTKECLFQLTDASILDFLELPNDMSYLFAEQTGISIYKNQERLTWSETNFMRVAKVESFDCNEVLLIADIGDGIEEIKIPIENH